MIFIGVTGGIGSGKSTVCSLFAQSGIPIFYADEVAKELADSKALPMIVEKFGAGVLDTSRKLDRKKLADIVFSDEKKLHSLNDIIHPHVFDEFEQWKKLKHGNTRYSLVEAALMFESGMFERVDYVLALVSNEKKRIKRVVTRDATTEHRIAKRILNQLPTQEVIELSDFQLHNDGSLSELHSKVKFFQILFSTLNPRKEEE